MLSYCVTGNVIIVLVQKNYYDNSSQTATFTAVLITGLGTQTVKHYSEMRIDKTNVGIGRNFNTHEFTSKHKIHRV